MPAKASRYAATQQAHQLLAYQKNGTTYGAHKTTFNSFIGSLREPELKIVVLQEKEFTRENLNAVIDKKVYGVCVLIKNLDTFVASKKWTDAYRLAGTRPVSSPRKPEHPGLLPRRGQQPWRQPEEPERKP